MPRPATHHPQPFQDGIFLRDLAEDNLEDVSRATAELSDPALLLILDDFERGVIPSALLQKLLTRAPHRKLLVTSRAPLDVRCERVLHIDGLRMPADEDEIETADASVLFVQEARRTSVGYRLPDRERFPLVRLCHLLGGFPLALVLAARWATVLPCSSLIGELQAGVGLELLATTNGDLPERHRAITGTLQQRLGERISASASSNDTVFRVA